MTLEVAQIKYLKLKNSDIGIKSSGSGSGQYKVSIIDIETGQLFYSFNASANTGGSLENSGYTIGTGTFHWYCYVGFCSFGNSGEVTRQSNDLYYLKKKMNTVIRHDIFFDSDVVAADGGAFGGTDKFYKVGDTHFDVIVKIETTGPSLNDIDELRIPGYPEPLTILENEVFVKDYTDPCATNANFPGCDAVSDFKDVSSSTKKKPIVVAHRGFHGTRDVPENSIAAVHRAYESGFRYVEVDIRMTKDNVPFLFHDDYYGYATDFATRNNTNTNTHTEERNWKDVNQYHYRDRYWDRQYLTASNSTNQHVRLGSVTDFELDSFSSLCRYIQGKDIMVFLDIKSAPTARNFAVMKECIRIGAKNNVLHQLGFKVVRTNLPDTHPNKLLMPLSEAQSALGQVYNTFKNHLNIHVVDYDPSLGTAYITDWINQGNVIGFEFDTQNPGASWEDGSKPSMFAPPAFSSNIYPGSRNAWEYTKSQGYRTGVWSSGPADPRGRPGHDPSKWGTGAITVNINRNQHYNDIRSRFEIVNYAAPEYITQDRPDIWEAYLQAVGKNNSDTKR